MGVGDKAKLIAISGGIGSGKSVVCTVLRCMGYDVYDCDSQAKAIMDASDNIRHRIAREVCEAAILPDGSIDRKALGSAVFADRQKLDRLNAIVHAAVRHDIEQWRADREGLCFVETAILYQSGVDSLVSEVWEVTAPEALRIERVCCRNSISAAEVRARIKSQQYEPAARHPREYTIINDGRESILLQIAERLR